MEIQNFKVIRSLGIGATSEVFEAINLKTDISVAIKIFSPLVANDDETMRRLRSEFDILKQLRHPNIVTPLSEFKDSKIYGLELELVRGCDLKAWSKSYDLPLLEPKLWVLGQIARGLGAAHEIEILHRDLKPENVIVSENGEVKITDFGLARSISRVTMTRSGLLIGSLGYMAPEVINGLKATEKSDMFSFGIIAYELLTGSAPFQGETPQALIKAITDGKFVPLREKLATIPTQIAELIGQCLAVDPSERPQGIWSLEAEIMNLLSQTRLLIFCREMVSMRRSAVLGQVYAIKHRLLKERIQNLDVNSQKDPSSETRKALLVCASEMKTLFPEDPFSENFIAQLSKLKKTEREFVRPLVAAFFIISTVFLFWWRHSRILPLKTVPVTTSPVQIAQSVPPSQDVRPIQPVRPVLAPAAEGRTGRLQFDADDDVTVYVDDHYVPKTRWNSYPIKAGIYSIKLAKEGFLPIENFVQVSVGKVTVVRARGKK